MKIIIAITIAAITSMSFANEFKQESEVKRKHGIEYKWIYTVSKKGSHKLNYKCLKKIDKDVNVWIETNADLDDCKNT